MVPSIVEAKELMAIKQRFARRHGLLFLCTAVVVAFQANIANGTPVSIKLRVESLAPARLVIEGNHESGLQTWSFRKAYGGVMGLGERITGLALTDRNGKTVEVRKLAPGEYQ